MINESRALLAKACEPAGWDVYTHEPANVYNVPCIVVGRPTMTILSGLFTITNPVWTIGRRDGTTEAGAQLDEVTDYVIQCLRHAAVVTELTPLIREIAELNYPAYRIDCVTGQGQC